MAHRIRRVAGWLLQVLMAAAFVAIGLGKFGSPFWERSFARWGYPAGAHLVVGVVEIIGGVLILVPRFTSYAAFGLATVMVGAIVTQARAGEMWTRPVPHLVVLLLLAALRWPERWRRSPASSMPGVAATRS
jgi:putative oxidoreductase